MCMMSDDYVELLGETEPTARKAHLCGECGRTIEAGETYRRHSYIFDGDFTSHAFCAQCWASSRWLVVVCSGWIYGAVVEDLAEHLAEYVHGAPPRSSHLTRLVRYSRRGWRRRDGSLAPVADVEAWVGAALSRVPNEIRGAA